MKMTINAFLFGYIFTDNVSKENLSDLVAALIKCSSQIVPMTSSQNVRAEREFQKSHLNTLTRGMTVMCSYIVFLYIFGTHVLVTGVAGGSAIREQLKVVKEGEPVVTLPCRDVADPTGGTVRWNLGTGNGDVIIMKNSRNEVHVDPSYGGRVNLGSNGELQLELPQLEDTNNYTCTVQHDKSYNEHSIELHVRRARVSWAPRNLTITVISKNPFKILLSWKVPVVVYGWTEGYRVQWGRRNGNWSIITTNGNKASTKILLENNIDYIFRVSIKTSYGYGAVAIESFNTNTTQVWLTKSSGSKAGLILGVFITAFAILSLILCGVYILRKHRRSNKGYSPSGGQMTNECKSRTHPAGASPSRKNGLLLEGELAN